MTARFVVAVGSLGDHAIEFEHHQRGGQLRRAQASLFSDRIRREDRTTTETGENVRLVCIQVCRGFRCPPFGFGRDRLRSQSFEIIQLRKQIVDAGHQRRTVADQLVTTRARVLVDPAGHQVLAWPRDPDIKALSRDLSRLLRASRTTPAG